MHSMEFEVWSMDYLIFETHLRTMQAFKDILYVANISVNIA